MVSGLKIKGSIIVMSGFKDAALQGIEFVKDEGRDRFTQRFVRVVWASGPSINQLKVFVQTRISSLL